MKEILLRKIEEQGGVGPPYDNNILVSIEDFFDGNNVKGSFAANACTKEININEFCSIFRSISIFRRIRCYEAKNKLIY